MAWFVCSVFFLFGSFSASPGGTLPVSFVELTKDPDVAKQWHEKPVLLRGFLYQDKQGQWILASEPNLKSCCVGSESKRTHQIFVQPKGAFKTTPKSAVTLKGEFTVDPQNRYNYVLKNAYLTEGNANLLHMLIVGFVLIGVFFILYVVKYCLALFSTH
ncbi:Uncharacterized protein PHSC3_000880 [Chlamydiales bacterium STE3]|nr:Uncharacterized protein PHSC3_000880 [Chlamydiales bacterium STE3]